jgi:diaminohydroxyphosphoribosylaminopyrimidine deaminase/5-amino-6-(5-phosphoribosylamino)uracil reductase
MVSAYYLNEALKEAQKADPKAVRPNPLVGAVVVDENQAIVGCGYHHQVGTPHAEVHAIADAEKNGADLSKCALYVTLEPCSHHGRTPPCTDLILEKGIKKVVIGSLDPNPLVSGVELLRSKGVEVEINIIREIEELNRVFFVNQREQRPYFQFKMAMTSNGVYGRQNVSRLWISGPEAGRYVHEELRSSVDAILSTAKSVINDNSKLNVRRDDQEEEKTAIILDLQLSLLLPENKHLDILKERQNSKLLLVTSRQAELDILPPHLEILVVPENTAGKLCLSSLSKLLIQKGYYKILVEAGYNLFKQMQTLNMIDKSMLIVSDKLFNADVSNLYFPDVTELTQKNQLEGFVLKEKMQLGSDILFQFRKESSRNLLP